MMIAFERETNKKWKVKEIHGIEEDVDATVRVLAAKLNPKKANDLIKELGIKFPLKNLSHVKRIRRKKEEDGSLDLSIILCTLETKENYETAQFLNLLNSPGLPNLNNPQNSSATENPPGNATENPPENPTENPPGNATETPTENPPETILSLIRMNKLQVFETVVPKWEAKSKEEWQKQSTIWPTSFHPNDINSNICLSDVELSDMIDFMHAATWQANVAKAEGQLCNGVVIVDPSSNKIISYGHDQSHKWKNSSYSSLPSSPSLQASTPSFLIHRSFTSLFSSTCFPPLPSTLSSPSPFSFPSPSPSPLHCFPLRHAVMVAIESASFRDLHLFPPSPPPSPSPFPPSSQIHGYLSSKESMDSYSKLLSNGKIEKMKNGKAGDGEGDERECQGECKGMENNKEKEDAGCKRIKLDEDHNSSSKVKVNESQTLTPIPLPYLCTGFDVYVAKEPCIMCAMALVHQRFRRVIYSISNPSYGAYENIKLHSLKGLNHHYRVFKLSPWNEGMNE